MTIPRSANEKDQSLLTTLQHLQVSLGEAMRVAGGFTHGMMIVPRTDSSAREVRVNKPLMGIRAPVVYRVAQRGRLQAEHRQRIVTVEKAKNPASSPDWLDAQFKT